MLYRKFLDRALLSRSVNKLSKVKMLYTVRLVLDEGPVRLTSSAHIIYNTISCSR